MPSTPSVEGPFPFHSFFPPFNAVPILILELADVQKLCFVLFFAVRTSGPFVALASSPSLLAASIRLLCYQRRLSHSFLFRLLAVYDLCRTQQLILCRPLASWFKIVQVTTEGEHRGSATSSSCRAGSLMQRRSSAAIA